MMSDTTIISTKCPWCGKSDAIEVPNDGYAAFMRGAHPQDAFPGMNATHREQLMTGICQTCWDKYVVGEDE